MFFYFDADKCILCVFHEICDVSNVIQRPEMYAYLIGYDMSFIEINTQRKSSKTSACFIENLMFY